MQIPNLNFKFGNLLTFCLAKIAFRHSVGPNSTLLYHWINIVSHIFYTEFQLPWDFCWIVTENDHSKTKNIKIQTFLLSDDNSNFKSNFYANFESDFEIFIKRSFRPEKCLLVVNLPTFWWNKAVIRISRSKPKSVRKFDLITMLPFLMRKAVGIFYVTFPMNFQIMYLLVYCIVYSACKYLSVFVISVVVGEKRGRRECRAAGIAEKRWKIISKCTQKRNTGRRVQVFSNKSKPTKHC